MAGWIYGASVHVTSKINRQVRLIAYCVLLARELLDLGHVTCASLRDNYQGKKKLEQSSVKDGLEVKINYFQVCW